MPGLKLAFQQVAQTWSAKVQIDCQPTSLNRRHKQYEREHESKAFASGYLDLNRVAELTVEFHGDPASFLIIHDSIGVVVGLSDHNIGVQLGSRS